jgi:type II secretory pathway component GspD/PulD (secretin)
MPGLPRRLLARLGVWALFASAATASAQDQATLADPEWRSDQSVYMIAIEALVVEVNEDRSRALGLQYDYTRNDVSDVVEGADLIFGPRFDRVSVPQEFLGVAGFIPHDPTAQLGGAVGFNNQRLPGLGLTLAGLDVSGGVVSARLRTLLDEGEARLSTRPVVLTLDGTATKLNAGNKVPFQQLKANKADQLEVTERQVGVILEVTPTIVDLIAGSVELNLTNVEVSAVKNFVRTSGIDLPAFSESKTATKVTVRSGETVKLSSMKLRRKREVRQGIPYLMKIPLFGFLFGSTETFEERVDVLVFVTPHIVPPGQNLLVPYDFGRARELVERGALERDR